MDSSFSRLLPATDKRIVYRLHLYFTLVLILYLKRKIIVTYSVKKSKRLPKKTKNICNKIVKSFSFKGIFIARTISQKIAAKPIDKIKKSCYNNINRRKCLSLLGGDRLRE